MKRIITKRLLYRNIYTNELFYGGEEYDGHLTNYNILGSIYVIGKHEWCPYCLSLYQRNQNGDFVYQIYVEQFEYAEKSWYNLFWDWVRRII
jgi:hypothetical protein